MPQEAGDKTRLVGLPCACASLRRAARAVTQLYDEVLRDTGLRTTQFTLLQVLATTGRIKQGRLGDLLSLDSTTLTRTLRPLVGKGWVRSAAGKDRRERLYELAAAGRRELDRALPAWERAQQRLRKGLGGGRFERLQSVLLEVTAAARQA